MIADGQVVGDGSWELKVLVTDLSVERCLRVKGDVHIGGVMLRLVEELGKNHNNNSANTLYYQFIQEIQPVTY